MSRGESFCRRVVIITIFIMSLVVMEKLVIATTTTVTTTTTTTNYRDGNCRKLASRRITERNLIQR